MKRTLIAIVLFLLTIFNSCNNESKLSIKDLTFGNPERSFIVSNKIDTVLVLRTQNTWKGIEIDTFGFRIYDSTGKLKREVFNIFFGHFLSFTYDSNGLMNYSDYSTDFSLEHRYQNTFYPDSQLLRYVTHDDTFYSHFDAKGRIIHSNFIDYEFKELGDRSRCDITYSYNEGRLETVEKRTTGWYLEKLLTLEKKLGQAVCKGTMTDYFYSNKILDSMIVMHDFGKENNQNYLSKTYYNSKGLREKTIQNDSLTFHYLY